MFGALPYGVGQGGLQKNGSPLAAMGITTMSQSQVSPSAVTTGRKTTRTTNSTTNTAGVDSGDQPLQQDGTGYNKWILIGGAAIAVWYFMAE